MHKERRGLVLLCNAESLSAFLAGVLVAVILAVITLKVLFDLKVSC